MKFKIKDFKLHIDETIFIVIIFCIIFKGIRNYFENYFICYLFIIFHELSHVLLASLFGIKTTKLTITISGLHVSLNDFNRNNYKWLIIFLAGPISNILLALIFKNIEIVYTINLALAIINLIPLYPLDGYNILETVLKLKKVKNAEKVKNVLEIMVITLLVIIAICQFVKFNNLSLIFIVFYIFIQSLSLRNNWDSAMYQKYYKNITIF